MAGFTLYGFLYGSYSNRKKGDDAMKQKQDIFWQKFLETGEVQDYLQYRKERSDGEDNPRRRIQDVTRKRKWY